MDGTKDRDPARAGHPHLERRVEGFGPVAFPVPPSSGGACVGGVPPEPEIRLEALALPTSRFSFANELAPIRSIMGFLARRKVL